MWYAKCDDVLHGSMCRRELIKKEDDGEEERKIREKKRKRKGKE